MISLFYYRYNFEISGRLWDIQKNKQTTLKFSLKLQSFFSKI